MENTIFGLYTLPFFDTLKTINFKFVSILGTYYITILLRNTNLSFLNKVNFHSIFGFLYTEVDLFADDQRIMTHASQPPLKQLLFERKE